jgi:class 3 adenylate cyclase/ketosteroid isomerase-like protein
VERSEELRSITARLWAAFSLGDVEAVVARLSFEEGVSAFGTDPTEFLHDAGQIERYTRASFDALGGGWPLGPAAVDAWDEGRVGWSIVRSEVVAIPDGPQPLRVTFVFHLERDEWKVVHQHWSVGVANEPVFGVSVPLEALAVAVRDEQPDLTASAAPDGTVTMAFTDIEDSTKLNASFGDRAWFEVLRAHNEIVARLTAEHGGTIVKRQGDGFMLTFPSSRRGLACAQSIEKEMGETFNDPGSPIKVRIGLHVGEAIHESNDFFGHAVNYAARVAGAAQGGEVLVSTLVHALAEHTGEFAFAEPRQVELKGIEGRQTVYPLMLQ